MTRLFECELKREFDALYSAEGATYDGWWIAGVKRGVGDELTPAEKRLLEDPERHLSAEAWGTVQGVIEYFESLKGCR